MRIAVGIVASISLFVSLNAFEFDIGVSGGDNRGVDGFYFSIGDYYQVPEREVYVVERTIPREEVNIAYFLARRAHRDVRFITDLRLGGHSWWDISLRLGLDPRTIYVVETYNDYGPPYGKAYGYYKDKHHRLSDREILELVNVRFLSEYHRISPDEVIERRQRGTHYYYDRDENRDRVHKVEKYSEERYKKERERDREDYKKEIERDREDYKKERERERDERNDRMNTRNKTYKEKDNDRGDKRGNGNNGRGRDW